MIAMGMGTGNRVHPPSLERGEGRVRFLLTRQGLNEDELPVFPLCLPAFAPRPSKRSLPN